MTFDGDGVCVVEFYENLDNFSVGLVYLDEDNRILHSEYIVLYDIEKNKSYRFESENRYLGVSKLQANLEFEYYVYSKVYFWE